MCEQTGDELRGIARRIAQAGGRMYRVGGGVRDAYLGLPAKDEDFCIVGFDDELISRVLPEAFAVGKSFPVYRLRSGGRVYELALARRERKAGSGHRGFAVEFGQEVTLTEDLVRRDLTVNAMAIDVLTDEHYDPYGGLDDLKRRVLRAVSDAFAEDPLRVYRTARFAAQLSFSVEPRTSAMMQRLAGELETLSVERVFDEFRKALRTAQPLRFFQALRDASALFPHFGAFGEEETFQRLKNLLAADATATKALQEPLSDEAIFAMVLLSLARDEDAHAFCQRMRVPELWKTAATLLRQPLFEENLSLHQRAERVVQRIRKLERCGLTIREYAHIRAVAEGIAQGWTAYAWLLDVAEGLRAIRGEDVMRENPTLSGPALGRAIEQRRVAYAMNVMEIRYGRDG